jgi:hypothetical protein
MRPKSADPDSRRRGGGGGSYSIATPTNHKTEFGKREMEALEHSSIRILSFPLSSLARACRSPSSRRSHREAEAYEDLLASIHIDFLHLSCLFLSFPLLSSVSFSCSRFLAIYHSLPFDPRAFTVAMVPKIPPTYSRFSSGRGQGGG